MGGSIFVGIRRGDGTEILHERWTNPLPDWLNRPTFWDKDERQLQKFIDAPDYDANVASVRPSEYGVVLIDFVTRQVLSRNDYTSVGCIHSSLLTIDKVTSLRGLKRRNWIRKYTRWAGHNRVELTAEEQKSFFAYCADVATGANVRANFWHCADNFVDVHWRPLRWNFNISHARARDCWLDVMDFLLLNEWKSPVMTPYEVHKEIEADSDDEKEEPGAQAE